MPVIAVIIAIVVAALLALLVWRMHAARAGVGRSDRGAGGRTPEVFELSADESLPSSVDTVGAATISVSAEERTPDFVEASEVSRVRERLGKSRGVFAGVRALRGRTASDDDIWEEIEAGLLRADVGVTTTNEILERLRATRRERSRTDSFTVVGELRELLIEDLENFNAGQVEDSGKRGTRSLRVDGIDGVVDVWLVVGVNGVGKTTTIGKLAARETRHGRSVLLAAGDTFRAAAGEQLAHWADHGNLDIVRGADGADPSSIVFDAVQRAAARGMGLVLADTAGRLHTKVNLVEELRKIRRVADRSPGKVTEVLLVIDATTGQNALSQAREFTEAVDVTGIVLTKLDGSAKAGFAIAVQRELGIPVKLVGIGEGVDDLVEFDSASYVDALVAN